MKILYFTSTGNCLAVAKRFDAEFLSIPQMLKSKRFDIKDDSIGIVFPVYGLSLPTIVRTYLKQCRLEADYIFVIATYGNADGAVLHEVKKVLEVNGNRADYYETLLMVDNYLPMFEVRDQITRLKAKGTEDNLNRIVNEVNDRKKKYTDRGLGWNLISAAMGAAGGTVKNRAIRWFRVNDKCIGCGICAKVCPVSNVYQSNKNKPIFGKECASCFACVHNCPKKAIHLKNEKSSERFRNSDIELSDIIESNNQK